MRLRNVSASLTASLLAACALGCSPSPIGSLEQAVVYGDDDRVEVHAHPSPVLRSVAESAVAVHLNNGALDESNPANIRVTYSRTLGEAKDLCPGERFAEQIEPGVCSGTLIDDQHILTAGHCVDEADDCDGTTAWVLGFRVQPDGSIAPIVADDVYRCAQVLAYRDDNADHALIRLDRPVRGHTPATVRVFEAGLPLGTPLTLMGHPNGLPLKIASGGTITYSDPGGEDLLATLDAFSGNSGSGVFNDAGELVAILDGGDTDYIENGDCSIVNVISVPEDDGESLTYAKPAIEAFCRLPGVDSPVCDCDGPCVEALPGNTCENAETVEAVDQVLRGNLAGFVNNSEGSCGGAGPERVWRFSIDRMTEFQAESGGFDSVLYIRSECDGADLACHDDIDVDNNRGSRISRRLAPGEYRLFLDSYDVSTDAFTLTLSFNGVGPVVDAGPGTDAGPGSDGGPRTDAGPGRDSGPSGDGGANSDAGASTDSGGCAIHSQPSPMWLLLLGLILMRRRRL
ncbi:MAG: S1-C subfamily serine protease [Polyangiales bacterium]|jgi:S1-C subfamily serine protease